MIAAMDLMQDEERNTWTIYTKYMRFAGGLFWAPLILLCLPSRKEHKVIFLSYDIQLSYI
jgi:hypothetical protein